MHTLPTWWSIWFCTSPQPQYSLTTVTSRSPLSSTLCIHVPKHHSQSAVSWDSGNRPAALQVHLRFRTLKYRCGGRVWLWLRIQATASRLSRMTAFGMLGNPAKIMPKMTAQSSWVSTVVCKVKHVSSRPPEIYWMTFWLVSRSWRDWHLGAQAPSPTWVFSATILCRYLPSGWSSWSVGLFWGSQFLKSPKLG